MPWRLLMDGTDSVVIALAEAESGCVGSSPRVRSSVEERERESRPRRTPRRSFSTHASQSIASNKSRSRTRLSAPGRGAIRS
eukprot:787257-Rhodomonas_salina.1